MSGDAAASAGEGQSAAAAAGIAEQRRQFDLQRSDSRPYRMLGAGAVDKLGTLLGVNKHLAPGGLVDADTHGPNKALYASDPDYRAAWDTVLKRHGGRIGPDWANDMDFVDSEVRQLYTPKDMPSDDPEFGALTRKFTMADRDADPVYQSGLEFGAEEGRKAIERRMIAGGTGYDSGATIKALTRFGNDYGSTKAEGSYNRFTMDQGNLFNKLAAVSGIGQTAVGQSTTAGMNMANQVSDLGIQGANARGASGIAAANAMAGGFASAANGYQNKLLMDRIFPQKTTGGWTYEQLPGQYSLSNQQYG